MSLVDVAICAYGKPFQTATTLASLLSVSGDCIDRIYMQEEAHQPEGPSVGLVPGCFPEQTFVHYRPAHFTGTRVVARDELTDEAFRLSLRYQLAWEQTDKRYLFITHNDCLFEGNIVRSMIERLEGTDYTGVGIVGQCWNCPANYSGQCYGDRYESFKPSYDDAIRIVHEFPIPTDASCIDRPRLSDAISRVPAW